MVRGNKEKIPQYFLVYQILPPSEPAAAVNGAFDGGARPPREIGGGKTTLSGLSSE
jgi:hypothetical protein